MITAMGERPGRKLDTLQRIELAEGVEIQLRLAGPAVRGMAWMLDLAIKAGVILVLSIVISIFGAGFAILAGDKAGVGVAMGILLLAMFVIDWMYSVAFEVSPWGATPGKRKMGLRVAQTSGAPITLHQAVVRNLIRGIDLLPFGGTVGLVSCLVSSRFQRLGDLAADTVVVYAGEAVPQRKASDAPEGARGQRPPVPMTREEQEAVLSFESRYGEWPEARRREVAGLARILTRVDEERAVGRLLGLAQWIRTEG